MEENWLHARQAEEKRAAIATVNLVMTSGVLVVLIFTGLHPYVILLTCWLIILGSYGIVTCLKLYERSQYHLLRARKLHARLDTLCLDAQVEPLLQVAEQEHRRSIYRTMMHVRLNSLWIGLHGIIASLGVLSTVLCFIR